MSFADMKELACCLKFKEVPQFQNVISWNTPGDIFYIIIKGLVSIQVPNLKAGSGRDFKFKNREYSNLTDWKTRIFDPKVAKQKRDSYDFYQEELLEAVEEKFVAQDAVGNGF